MESRFRQIVSFDRERAVIKRMVDDCVAPRTNPSVLDVGCGFGRNLNYLTRPGLRIVGVDTNPEAVWRNRNLGLECYMPDAGDWRDQYDCILMSHIIEHFPPADLVSFIEGYLDYLKPGGFLIVATPLLTNYFFEDFTHIKPYLPESILMVFGHSNRQVSIRSSAKLELRDVWFRTSAFKLRCFKFCYTTHTGTILARGINGVLSLMHVGSLGLFGKKDGWVGIFEKVV